MVNVWRLMAHHVKCCRLPMIQWAIANNRVALGWGLIDDIGQYAAPRDIRARAGVIADQQDNDPLNFYRRPTLGINLWNFYGGPGRSFYPRVNDDPDGRRDAMRCGDLVILKTDAWSQSVVMQVTDPYEYVDLPGHVDPPQALPCLVCYGYRHQRKAVHKDISPKELWVTAGRAVPHQSVRGNALILCQFQV